MPEIAVVMAVRLMGSQDYEWLLEAITSVERQTFTDWELVIVVDKGLLTISVPEHPKIKTLHLPTHKGPGAARNAGVKATSAPWLLGFDADDRLKPDTLALFYQHRCEAQIVYGDFEWIGDLQGVKRINGWNLDDLQHLRGPVGITALLSRKAWELAGGWREDLEGLEDVELWIRLTELGVCGKHLDAVTFDYRRHAGSRTDNLRANGVANATHIKAMHANFMKGDIRMGCVGCPEGKVVMATGSNDGTIQLKYVGPALGSFNTPGAPATGNRYRIEGRGSYVNVDPRDVEYLQSFNRGGYPEFIVEVIEPVVSQFAAAIVQESVALASVVPDLSDMNVAEALESIEATSDLVDLRLMLTAEKLGANRKTVVKAVEKRIAELSHDGQA